MTWEQEAREVGTSDDIIAAARRERDSATELPDDCTLEGHWRMRRKFEERMFGVRGASAPEGSRRT